VVETLSDSESSRVAAADNQFTTRKQQNIYSILFYSILFYSIRFYSILNKYIFKCHKISVLFYSTLYVLTSVLFSDI